MQKLPASRRLTYAASLAFPGVLPDAPPADIADHDALSSGELRQGMFFAARTLQKYGRTFGVLHLAALTPFGKDSGDHLGIRLSGAVGFCSGAAIAFTRWYQERTLFGTTERPENGAPA